MDHLPALGNGEFMPQVMHRVLASSIYKGEGVGPKKGHKACEGSRTHIL